MAVLDNEARARVLLVSRNTWQLSAASMHEKCILASFIMSVDASIVI